REAVQRLRFALLVGAAHPYDLAVDLHLDSRRNRGLELSLGAFDFDGFVGHRDLDAVVNIYGQSSYAPHVRYLYQTEQMSSPPTLAFFASRSTKMPFGVERTLTPRPLRIGAISSMPT